MSTKRTETFVGPCSKYITGQGWTTEIPIEQIESKGYVRKAEMYDKGHRKIPEDAVVMTETERITMCVEQWDKGYNQARKETAKEILQGIMNIIKKSDGFLAQEVVRIMAKQKGVEVK